MESLYKSEQGKSEILKLYDSKLEELNIEYQYKTIDTSYGKTNIIISGNSENPPIIIIHGSNGCAPIALETYPNLTKKFRVYAVDVLAQPNKSAETRLNMKDESYGKWINEIIDSLKIVNVTMAGFSFGGLVILKTLEFNESKIKEVYLSAPAYIVNGNPIKTLFKIFIPMKRFMKTNKVKYVEKFLSEVFTEHDEFAIKFLSKVFLHFNMDFTPVPVINKKKANAIKTPITLIGAKNDILFPGTKMIKRASKIFPSLKTHILLQNSKHVQSKKNNEQSEEIILNK
jgi:pimeloyl-ACP methyl ester carboxylesterase